MTLIVGLIAKDGLVLTSDSRMTSGNAAISATQSNDTVRKIFKITDHCGMGISGSGEMGVTLIEEFQNKINKLNDQKLTVLNVAEEFRILCLSHYANWFQRLPADSDRIPDFNVLVCGYEKDANGELNDPKIIRMNSFFQFAPMTITTGYATLGITTIANYLLNRLYLRNEINLKQALSLASFCVIETKSQDGRVGGNLQAAMFSNTDPFREITDKEIVEVTTRCDEVLRNSFQISFYKSEPSPSPSEELKEEPKKAITKGPETPQEDAVKRE